jgi:hypothetical protein
MAGWEYKTFDLSKPKTAPESLNALGRDGWEAVAMVSSWGVGWRMVHPIVLLKRSLPDRPQLSSPTVNEITLTGVPRLQPTH